MTPRRTCGLAIPVLVLVTGTIGPRVAFADSDSFAPASTVLGQTGAVTVNSADVLLPWQTRFGISTFLASGSGGNRVDFLVSDAASRDQVLVVRGALAVGLPRGFEAAVTIPYTKVETDDVSTDGVGDITVSTKLRVRDQSGRVPATAVSVSWVPETARRLGLNSVTTNGYLATVSSQFTVVREEWTWLTMMAELGVFLRDPGRAESDASLVYGVAAIVPLYRTGLYVDTGEVQVVAEINGSSARTSPSLDPDDVVSFAPGLRYLADGWGMSATGAFSAYEQPDKEGSVGALLEFHLVL